ncbi:MAG: hypothetical protein QOD56_1123 [Gammaproteobacteria bacterium]|nr:hypothetical protein [Gammaproteobacteria bacterium]
MHQRIQTALFCLLVLSLIVVGATQTSAQPSASAPSASAARKFSKEDASYVAYDEPTIAFTNVQLVDGTGSAPKRDVTVLVQDGRIAGIAPSGKLEPPANATVIDGHGKTLLPGFVMVHGGPYGAPIRTQGRLAHVRHRSDGLRWGHSRVFRAPPDRADGARRLYLSASRADLHIERRPVCVTSASARPQGRTAVR